MGQSLEEKSRISAPSSSNSGSDSWKSKLVANGQWLGTKVWQAGGNAVHYVRGDGHTAIPDPVNDGRASWMASIRSGPTDHSKHMGSSNPYQESYYQQSYANSTPSGFQNAQEYRPGAYRDQVPIEKFYDEPDAKKNSKKKKKKKKSQDFAESSDDDYSPVGRPKSSSKKKLKKKKSKSKKIKEYLSSDEEKDSTIINKKNRSMRSEGKLQSKQKKKIKSLPVKESSGSDISSSSSESDVSISPYSCSGSDDTSEAESEKNFKIAKSKKHVDKKNQNGLCKDIKKAKKGKKKANNVLVADLLDVEVGSTEVGTNYTSSDSPFDLMSSTAQGMFLGYICVLFNSIFRVVRFNL